MSKHALKLIYEAAGSDDYLDGGLVTSNSKKAFDGAQELVCAHAHYYCEGRVPDNVMPRTNDFAFKNPSVHGGELKFTLDIIGPSIWPDGEFDFSSFFTQSYRGWETGKLFDEPPVSRRQLNLRDLSGNAPEVAREFELDQYSRLYRRIDRAIADLTKPIGISASSLILLWNGKTLAQFRGRHKKFTDEELAQAILALKITPRIPEGFRPN